MSNMVNSVTGTQFGSIKPSQKQQALETNYLNFTTQGSDANTFAQQYLPEIYEAEVERYGNRTLSGFLRMVGAEMPMSSDQIVWSEQNRLHIAYNNVSCATATTLVFTTGGTGINFVANAISPGQTLVIMDPTTGKELKVLVTESSTASTTATLTVYPYTQASLTSGAILFPVTTVGNGGLKIFVYGSEWKKGTGDAAINAVTPSFTQYSNSPIIIKERYQISGSDTAQIGWVEVATEDGTGGFLWYLKAESETRLRFEDYLEMSMIEAEPVAAASGVAGITTFNGVAVTAGSAYNGSQGLFSAIKQRGNVVNNFTAAAGLSDFDSILKGLDTQGAIEENMFFLNRATSLDFDDMLASLSAGAAGGVAYGLFENSEQMALNLGFSGFRRGSYDFYKTDWKYLNDASTRGGMANTSIDGVLVPAGTSTVYDQQLGTNIRRPFLHVRYRANQADDRRMKTWITGSVGGAYTSDLDAMQVHFLSERCLVTQAANNFVLFTATQA
jgi:hypothetical protein